METYPDFQEFFRHLNAQGVEYVVVGGYALGHHGWPRYTRDLDVYAHANPTNAQRVIQALVAFGFDLPDLRVSHFSRPRFVIRLGREPVQIDILTEVSGVTWDEVWRQKSSGDYGGVPVHYIGREQLIANKRAAGRPRDLADIADLGEEV